MPKVSIIVPVYNVEKYLSECINSIVNQSLKDIEIILVDDGSPDSCPQIIDEYAAKDNRVVAIHKENGGYATAINKGLEVAKSKYIGIVESDDWCSLNMYETLHNCIKDSDADYVISNYYWYYDVENRLYKIRDLSKFIDGYKDNYTNINLSPKLFFSANGPWKNLYRKSFLEKYNVKMLEDNIRSYQDVTWNATILAKAKKILFCEEPLYCYRADAEGSSTNCGKRSVITYLDRRLQALDILKENNLYSGDIKKAYDYALVKASFTFLKKIGFEFKEEYYNKMKEIFIMLLNDNFDYKYFSVENKERFNAVINKNYRQFFRWHKWKEFNKNFLGVYKTEQHTQIAIFGLKIKIKRKNKNA